jgi:hypothetical protein
MRQKVARGNEASPMCPGMDTLEATVALIGVSTIGALESVASSADFYNLERDSFRQNRSSVRSL